MVEEMLPTIIDVVKNNGAVGVYAIIATYAGYRLYLRQITIYERLIKKEKTQRDQAQELLDSLLKLSDDLVEASEKLGKAISEVLEKTGKRRQP